MKRRREGGEKRGEEGGREWEKGGGMERERKRWERSRAKSGGGKRGGLFWVRKAHSAIVPSSLGWSLPGLWHLAVIASKLPPSCPQNSSNSTVHCMQVTGVWAGMAGHKSKATC